MPKRPRQAHIPGQQVSRRRTPRRVFGASAAPEATVPDSELYEGATALEPAAPLTNGGAVSSVEARPRRRLEVLQRTQATAAPVRANPGALPTFDHHYLMSELKTIAIISTSLLALILVLTVILR